MASTPPTALRDVADKFNRTIGPWVPEPTAAYEPDELQFLETVAAYHRGDTLPAMVPRTESYYERNVVRFVKLLTLIMAVWTTAMATYGAGDRTDTVDPEILRFIYETFDIRHTYPLVNLLYRIMSNISAVLSNPEPRFQRRFFRDMPIEVVQMIADASDYAIFRALAQTARSYRYFDTRRSNEKAHFVLRYRNWVLHGPTTIGLHSLCTDVHDAVDEARERLLESAYAFLACLLAFRNVRFLSIDNEWARLWPRLVKRRIMPRPNSRDLYEPIICAIASMLSAPCLETVRFVSLSLTARIVDRISGNASIRGLILERYGAGYCVPNLFMPGLRKLTNIIFLGIRIDLELGTVGKSWTVMTACPNLRHLHVFSDPYARTGFLFPGNDTGPVNIYQLESLHIDGCTHNLRDLLRWLSATPTRSERPGNLRRLKIRSIRPIDEADSLRLVSILHRFYPNIRILVLEGLLRVQPHLLRRISDCMKSLESLSITNRASKRHLRDKLVAWERPGYEYAEALRGIPTLQHLELNMLWCAQSPTPRVIYDLHAIQDRACVYRDLDAYYEGWTAVPCDGVNCRASHLAESGEATDDFDDGFSVLIPFLCGLPRLESFALRDVESHYSCLIEAETTGNRGLRKVYNVHTGAHRARAWVNPYGESTWDY
ncbi:hypothetical protein AURDEDRAFT_175490 [Auricularia subglabra TFB-10046 SS5]|uniref:Uncharacterized protein n=1 Tax=Auricularia subglabra (strain TFB-10046 / SS5) TaxID=717982 RepID=J0LEW5_AURST|nr:hypothetical protein AURDEDRAFT_175490 [Auricularia subglabra TFB-10046 SS5]